ncbi:acyltransferase family protein [Bacillus sp. DJP31]|uniref:acyltransferase family protein n=1 Tax=Bacillus sp. DJP31 TaxID=3409789 RepID=UPI003BB5B407
MGFFFLLSGYFTPGSYDRKGWKLFLTDRLIRLGIPLLLYVFILGPVITYSAHFRVSMTLLDYYMSEVINLKTVHMGPLWFVQTLLYFSVFYVFYRKIRGGTIQKRWEFPSQTIFLLTAMLLGIVAFLIRLIWPVGEGILGLQFGYFPSYILLFILGTLAYRQQWLESISSKLVKSWIFISLVSIPILPIGLILTGALEGNISFEGGVSVQALLYALWEPFVAFGIILWLLYHFQLKVNQPPTRFKTMLSSSAYTVFIIHPVIIVSLSILFTSFVMHPFIKFLFVGSIGTVLCFVIAILIVKIPYVKRVL